MRSMTKWWLWFRLFVLELRSMDEGSFRHQNALYEIFSAQGKADYWVRSRRYRPRFCINKRLEWVRIGMKQIAGSDGNPFVFSLERYDDGLWLDNRWAKPDDEWNSDHEFVFRLRKSES